MVELGGAGLIPGLPARVERKIEFVLEVGCWIWMGCLVNGYGKVRVNKVLYLVHRYVYALQHGDILAGKECHHTCGEKSCCNPDHIQVLSRLDHRKADGRYRTHCPQGHPYSGDNLYIRTSGGRECHTCRRDRERLRRWQKRNQK